MSFLKLLYVLSLVQHSPTLVYYSMWMCLSVVLLGIDIDCLGGRVYWSDITGQSIKSSKYDGTDVQNFLTSGMMQTIRFRATQFVAIHWFIPHLRQMLNPFVAQMHRNSWYILSFLAFLCSKIFHLENSMETTALTFTSGFNPAF